MWVMSVRPPLGTSLQEMADDAAKHAGQEFGSQVSDVTAEIGELGDRRVLRVRFLANEEDGSGAAPFVVRRTLLLEGGRLLILNGLIKDPANEEALTPALDEAAKTLRFWLP